MRVTRMPKSTLLAGVLFSLLGCDNSGGIYTLYRSAPIIGNIQGDKVRIHVATFDASVGGD